MVNKQPFAPNSPFPQKGCANTLNGGFLFGVFLRLVWFPSRFNVSTSGFLPLLHNDATLLAVRGRGGGGGGVGGGGGGVFGYQVKGDATSTTSMMSIDNPVKKCCNSIRVSQIIFLCWKRKITTTL